jgi:hypothetical protein
VLPVPGTVADLGNVADRRGTAICARQLVAEIATIKSRGDRMARQDRGGRQRVAVADGSEARVNSWLPKPHQCYYVCFPVKMPSLLSRVSHFDKNVAFRQLVAVDNNAPAVAGYVTDAKRWNIPARC